MNIFILDYDMEKNAHYHCNKHVVKMLLEQGQLLSTAYRLTHGVLSTVEFPHQRIRATHILPQFGEEPGMLSKERCSIYWPTHQNHPCSKWVRESHNNFDWLLRFTQALHSEWKWRFDHTGRFERHGVWPVVEKLVSMDHIELPDIGFTPFAQAMPDKYRREDPVEAYRAYYIGAKRHLADWGKRGQPEWWR